MKSAIEQGDERGAKKRGGTASGPEIASGAIAAARGGEERKVITRQSHLPQNCKSFIRHNDILARLRLARLMAGALLLRARADSQAAILRRAKQSTPISNPLLPPTLAASQPFRMRIIGNTVGDYTPAG